MSHIHRRWDTSSLTTCSTPLLCSSFYISRCKLEDIVQKPLPFAVAVVIARRRENHVLGEMKSESGREANLYSNSSVSQPIHAYSSPLKKLAWNTSLTSSAEMNNPSRPQNELDPLLNKDNEDITKNKAFQRIPVDKQILAYIDTHKLGRRKPQKKRKEDRKIEYQKVC